MTQRGITLISVTEPDPGSTDPTRSMFRQILEAIHQYEKTMIVLKLPKLGFECVRGRVAAKAGNRSGIKPGEAEVLARHAGNADRW